ncbi:MAG: radical SAM protein [Planctomycetota bacterium]|nr:radical SAM protein [Planctomycetota bacterium]
MQNIPAKTVYIDPAVLELENCRTRWERMKPFILCDDIRSLDEEAKADISRIRQRRHGKDDFGDDAVLVFTTLNEDRWKWYHNWRDAGNIYSREKVHCQSAAELNLIMGCPFRCSYCGFGRLVTIPLDVEAFASRLDDSLSAHPNQTLWKFSNMTDLPPFEPEYGAVPMMVERFAREPSSWLLLFTKSDAVDFLLPLDHGGHTIIAWSMSSEIVSRTIEKRTAELSERLSAMRKTQDAGYTVRARLSPIVPIVNWRNEYRDFFERLFETVQPDVVTLHALGWFDFKDLDQVIPREMIDSHAYERARESAQVMQGHRNGPLPHDVRAELYDFCISEVERLSPETPVGLCLETTEMWEQFGPRIGMAPKNYVCNCGPTCAPGNPLIHIKAS